MLRIAVIIGSTRPGRNGEAVAKWVYDIARNAPMPNLNWWTSLSLISLSLTSPCRQFLASTAITTHGYGRRRLPHSTVMCLSRPNTTDSTSAALKNAIDFLCNEWTNKAAGFVAYGGAMGARAVENQLLVATIRRV
jgi:NAD(P)H-dependent FMN reductase